VLEVSTGPHHRVELRRYTNWSQLQTETLDNFLQRCQCAIVLIWFHFPVPSLILDALRGGCNLVELSLHQVPNIDRLIPALVENKSLVRLGFYETRISDNHWTVLCQSLSIHPKIEFLGLDSTFPCGRKNSNERKASNERKTRRTNVFLSMLQANTVLRQLDAPRAIVEPQYDEFDERILSDVIQPYFRHLQHVRDFGQYRGPGYALELARALYKVDDSPGLTWMLIRSNIPTFCSNVPTISEVGEDNMEGIVLDT
jgi:hypothetical protein